MAARRGAGRRPQSHHRSTVGGGATAGGGTHPTSPRALKRRPCQDIRGPQRLTSYQIPGANTDKELAVIRAIIAREQSVAELLHHVSKYRPAVVSGKSTAHGGSMHASSACFGALDQRTTDLLLRVRVASVGVCEAVSAWRMQLTGPRPFIWQRKNYLQGMACDVNFVHYNSHVAGVLGRTKRNPFVVEGRNMDELARGRLWRDAGNNDIDGYRATAPVDVRSPLLHSNPVKNEVAPISLTAAAIGPERLLSAARLLIEEEERHGRADAKQPPPTWYIQRKKRMLAMGINLSAGAQTGDEDAEEAKAREKAKKLRAKRRLRAAAEAAVLAQKTKEEEEEKKKIKARQEAAEEEKDWASKSPSSRSTSKKKGKKRKKLLQVSDGGSGKNGAANAPKVQTEPVRIGRRMRSVRKARDGRAFVCSAEVWLLPSRPPPPKRKRRKQRTASDAGLGNATSRAVLVSGELLPRASVVEETEGEAQEDQPHSEGAGTAAAGSSSRPGSRKRKKRKEKRKVAGSAAMLNPGLLPDEQGRVEQEQRRAGSDPEDSRLQVHGQGDTRDSSGGGPALDGTGVMAGSGETAGTMIPTQHVRKSEGDDNGGGDDDDKDDDCVNDDGEDDPLALPSEAEEKSRLELRVEVAFPLLYPLQMLAASISRANTARLCVSLAELEAGGFIYAGELSMLLPPAPLLLEAPAAAVLPPLGKVKKGKNGKRKNFGAKRSKTGGSKKKKKSSTSPKKQKNDKRALTSVDAFAAALSRRSQWRIDIGTAAAQFLMDRLVPTLSGGIVWQQDGPTVQRNNRRRREKIRKHHQQQQQQLLLHNDGAGTGWPESLFASASVDRTDTVVAVNPSVAPATTFGPDDEDARVDEKAQRAQRLAREFRVGIRLGRIWCAVRAWYHRHQPPSRRQQRHCGSGGGMGLTLEIDLTTVTALSSSASVYSEPQTKRLSLHFAALVRLLGAEIFLAHREKRKQQKLASRSKRRKQGGNGGNSRPSSRGSSTAGASRPSSRSSSRPPSRSASSRPSSRPSSRSSSRASSRPSSRGASTSNAGGRRTNKRTSSAGMPPGGPAAFSVTVPRPNIALGKGELPSGTAPGAGTGEETVTLKPEDTPPLSEVVTALLRFGCIVAIETAEGGVEFYAQARPYAHSTHSGQGGKAKTPGLRLPTPVAPAGVLAAAREKLAAALASGQQHEAENVSEAKTERKKSRVKGTIIRDGMRRVLATAKEIGGLFFAVEVREEALDTASAAPDATKKKNKAKKGDPSWYQVDATYPGSIAGGAGGPRVLSVRVPARKANAVALTVAAEAAASEDKEAGAAPLGVAGGHRAYVVKALLSRLDLDDSLPPKLIFRGMLGEKDAEAEDSSSGPAPAKPPLIALMASSEASDPRPMSPMLLPIFKRSVSTAEKKAQRQHAADKAAEGPDAHLDRQDAALKFLAKVVERSRRVEQSKDLKAEADGMESQHRDALASVEQLKVSISGGGSGGVMRIQLIPSPTKTRQPEKE